MNIEKARQFLSLPEDLSKWDSDAWRMLRDPTTFLSVPWGEETDEIVALWNKNSPKELTIVAVADSAQTPVGFTHHLSCSGRTVDVPYRASREDCFVVVLSINNLVKESIGLRLSRASTGNSDWCFMPQRHEDWASLEAQYGADFVNARFVRLPDGWEELESALGAA